MPPKGAQGLSQAQKDAQTAALKEKVGNFITHIKEKGIEEPDVQVLRDFFTKTELEAIRFSYAEESLHCTRSYLNIVECWFHKHNISIRGSVAAAGSGAQEEGHDGGGGLGFSQGTGPSGGEEGALGLPL